MPRIARTMAAALGLFGGVVASQGPEFAQQYRQRLGGAIDELRRVVQRFDVDAGANGHSREGAIGRLQTNPDDLVSRQGAAMRGNVERLERLERHRQAYLEAGPFQRLWVTVRDGDLDLMEATYHDFEPAVPATQEGVVAAGLGFAGGWAITLLIGSLGRRLFGRGRRRAQAHRLQASATLARPPSV
jgi:Protein of unknown function (DUF2937)